jgi:hypothetical protein
VLLTGCRRSASIDFVREREARMADVPFVLDARPVTDHITDSVYTYTSTVKIAELVAWYTSEMERVGWQLLAYNHENSQKASQILYIFEKPSKLCALRFEQACSRTKVRIDYMLKRTQTE